MSKEEAESAGVEERRRYFRVQSVKSNLALPSDIATWRQLVSVDLGNGGDGPSDFIGVAVPWSWPSPFDGMETSDLLAVQKKIAGGEWRADMRAANWAGVAIAEVLGLDHSQPSARGRLKAILKKWIDNGVLKVVKRKDGQRHEREFIEVGEWA